MTRQLFDELFNKDYPRLMAYACRFVDEFDAEDIVQDVFLELWNRRDKIDVGEHISAFLFKSTYTKCLNFIKHRKVVDGYNDKEYEILQLKLAYYSSHDNEILRRIESEELRNAIEQAIEGLPEKCREVFQMSYLLDMKNKEISEVMNVSLRTVEAHMYKALRVLRVNLKQFEMVLFLFLYLLKNKFSSF